MAPSAAGCPCGAVCVSAAPRGPEPAAKPPGRPAPVSIEDLVGQTPLVALSHLSRSSHSHIWAKLERANPGGSVKDRTARALIDDAEARGVIQHGSLLIEATSGNTGIALAMIAAARGYRMLLVMPEGQSRERHQIFHAYGAQVVESPHDEGTAGAVRLAKRIEAEVPGAYMTRQHENPANPRVHEATTGPEIWNDTRGAVDVVISAVGTGGTITGIGWYLKRQKSSVRMVAVEPAASAVLSGGPPGSHKIQGIGAGFVPKVLDQSIVDGIIPVSDEDAWERTRWLARHEGVMAGLSSGAAYRAAELWLERHPEPHQTVVIVFPDSGERYLSLGLYEPPPPFDRKRPGTL